MSRIVLANGRIVEDYGNQYFIAEVNSSHNGSVEVAKKMVDAAVQAGCDCVKFQSWSAKTLYSQTYYDQNPIAKRFVDKFSLSPDELKEMANYCREKNIDFSSTPYSNEEVDFLVNECKAPFIKISSMEVNNPQYLKYIASKDIPVIISTGMATYEETKRAIQIIEDAGNKRIAILHCVSVYPTPEERINLNNIHSLREMFPSYPIGFSDHTIGEKAALAATVLGAAVIEKHITLDSGKIGMDNQMAMEPEDFVSFIRNCRSIKETLGSRERILYPEELKSRDNMRRSVVSTRDIRAGEVLTESDLGVKRPGTGIEPKDIPFLLGKRVNKDIKADYLVQKTDIDGIIQ